MITSYKTYPNPAPSTVGAALSLIDSTSVTVPSLVFSSTQDGRPVDRGGVPQSNAITTIALCNTGTVDLTDETEDAVNVNIYLVKSGQSYDPANLIVSNLTVPAGETVFLSEERIVLEGGDMVYVGTSAASLLAVTISTLPV
jgi:hypothetical protein